MDFKEQMELLHIKQAIKGEVKVCLEDILMCLTRVKLLDIASQYLITGRSGLIKADLAGALALYITDPVNLTQLLILASNEEFETFQLLVNQKSLPIVQQTMRDYLYLMDIGLVFSFYHDNKLTLVMPNEIREAWYELDQNTVFNARDRLQLVKLYIEAMANLYGAIKLEKFFEILNSQNQETIDEIEFSVIYTALISRDNAFWLHEGYIVSDYFDENNLDEFSKLLERAENKSWYIPERSELLKYADDLYFDKTPQLKALKAYIVKNLCPDEILIEDLIDDIQLLCSMEEPLQEIINEFDRRDIIFNDTQQIKELVKLIMEVYNTSRLWANHGFTPMEMSQNKTESNIRYFNSPLDHRIVKQASVEKIGRNDPCPCGSGKKYKKCCGMLQK